MNTHDPGQLARDKLAQFSAGLTRTSLGAEAPTTQVKALPPGEETAGVLVLHVNDIDQYDRNPRTAPNAAYEDMKASIKAARAIVQKLTVTRRPGAARYMIHAGGNTRLAILKELWAETQDEVFGVQTVMFEPWVAESRTYAAHLIENTKRAEMTFWDRAAGSVRLREDLERESGESYSQRRLVEAFAEVGYGVSRGMVQQYEYAVAFLAPLGDWLTSDNVKALQPAINRLVQLAARFNIDEKTVFREIFWPDMQGMALVLRDRLSSQKATTLNVRELVEQLKGTLAARLEASPAQLDLWAEHLVVDEAASGDTLRALALDAPRGNASPENDGAASQPERIPPLPIHGAQEEPGRRDEGFVPVPDQPGDAVASSTAAIGIPNSSREADPLADVVDIATRLAAIAGVAEALVRSDAAPLGFYMEPHLPTTVDPYLAEAAWWILAVTAGQFYSHVWQSLPPDSSWAKLLSRTDEVASDASQHLLSPFADYVERLANGRYDPATRQPMIYADYLPLLLWHEAGTGPEVSELFQRALQLRRASPERFEFCRKQYQFEIKEAE
ncbi:ParB family protein [Burkholderia gladioli]|uniref:ParB family protein n=1 Tax=Burkholderia gladioli TaxID=28095 RepID=UPI00164058FF|nr:ParB family protein [Burkholderia gladioli]